MTLSDIQTLPLSVIWDFVDRYALTADISDQTVLTVLHAARNRICVESGWQQIAAKKAKREAA